MKKTTLLKSMLLLCALVVGSLNGWAVEYEKITSTAGLEAGANYLLVNNAGTYALGAVNASNVGGTVSVSVSENKITNPSSDVAVLTLGGTTGAWTFTSSKNSNKYLAYTKSKGTTKNNNLFIVDNSTDDGATWTITFSEGVPTITNVYNDERTLKFNSDRFCCYTTAQTAVALYKEIVSAGEATTTTIDASGITNTNKFVSTAAGTFTASVTYGSPATNVPGAAVTWSSSDEDVATVGESTGVVTLVGEGTTTITASYAGVVDTYKSSSAEYVLNVTNEDPNAVTLWSEDFSAYSEGDAPTGGTYSYVCEDGSTKTQIYNANNAGGTAPELLVNKSGGYFQATIPLENIKGNLKLKFKSNAYSVTVSTSTDGISIDGDNSFNALGEHTVTFTGVTTSKTSITIKFAAASSNVRIDDIVLKGSKVAPVTMGTNGYATFASSDKLDLSNLPDGLTAYKASIDGTAVKFAELSQKVPANTGIMLKGTASTTYNIPVVLSSSDVEGNAFLVNTTGATFTPDDDYNYFGLKKNTLIFGLFDPNTVAIPANKAYLKVSKSTPANELICVFDDGETTGINNVERMTINNDSYYNLNGQRVINPTKGLYIVNGKKVVIK